MPADLPIWNVQDAITQPILNQRPLVLVAPTGSGKSTQVPQIFRDMPEDIVPGRVVVLQPRRVAARSLAARVAWERQCSLGREVGYQVRFEERIAPETRIAFITEGILLRWLQDNPSLQGISAVIFDEFHERNLLSDVALAIVKHLRATDRSDLHLAVMSATLESEPVVRYLDNCPLVVSEGQSFPVTVHYQQRKDPSPISEQAAQVTRHIIESGQEGDILVFMPGMGEIQSTLNALKRLRLQEVLTLLPLHGDLAPDLQDQAFAPSNHRKVVVATNVAETSVTIPGIRHVIDGGLARVARYDSDRGLNTLHLEEISQASAEQRKGRAGRTDSGHCYRLWTESSQLNRPSRNTPEIQRTDLAEVVLLLHSLGIQEAAKFDWLDHPDSVALNRAETLLKTLGALDGTSGRLTETGRRMHQLPMHPRYSRMLVEAARRNCLKDAALCAALVSGRDLLQRPQRGNDTLSRARERFEINEDSDFFTLMEAFRFAEDQRFHLDACRAHGIHAQTARLVAQTRDQFLKLASRLNREQGADSDSPESLLRCLMTGFIDQLAQRRDGGTLECTLTEERQGTLARESVVQDAPLMVMGSVREISSRGRGAMTLLTLANRVELDWIRESFPQNLRTTFEHQYDRTHKRVASLRRTRFMDLILEDIHVKEMDDLESGRCLARAHLDGHFELPLFNHELKQFVARCQFLVAALPELELPPLDTLALVNLLGKALAGCHLAKEAQKAPLRESLHQHLSSSQREWLEEMAPSSLNWTGEKKRKLLYPSPATDKHGKVHPPELQIKLHECFSLDQHPTVCDGKVAVLLNLTAPNQKKLGSTLDWLKFKRQDYPRLKPTLQKKHPGVSWI